ncbi:MAG TPA: hypothetical protein VEC13_02330, partial [Candidatus Paceibacterota bacterium]|nr:hypothetical protein [Candidatus Paceibacterota bacterium]
MNKINHLLLLTLAIVASAFASLDYAEATVGGPTTISAIAHDSAQGSVYYTVHDGGGRGCPPIIHIIDLLTLKDRELKSCGDVEQDVFSDDGQANLEKYAQYRTDVYDKLSYMGSISLKKNNIDIRVTHLKENLFEDYVISNEFRATVMQDGKELA